MEEGYKPCPHCAEPIREGAKLCRYCNRPVGVMSQSDTPVTGAAASKPASNSKGLLVVAVLAVLLALGIYVAQNVRMAGARADQARQDFKSTATQSGTPPPNAEATPPMPPPRSPVIQVLARGNYAVQPSGYITFPFSVPQGATRAIVKGSFHAFGGTGNDIQAVIASPFEFENWINGHQAQVLYGTVKATNGTIGVEGIPAGNYILAFSNKFSALSRKQVTADIVLGYWP